MKITFIGNACCIYEADGFKLLADPWIVGTPFGSWVHSPPLKTKIEDVLGVDAIYISHCHQDHLDPESLKHFRRDVPIFVLDEPMHISARLLRARGFTSVNELVDAQRHQVGPFEVALLAPFVTHPFFGSDIGNVVDSAMWVECGGKKVLNANDNTMTPGIAAVFRTTYGAPDVAQLNWNPAGPYPACFRNLSNLEKLAEGAKILDRQIGNMAAVALALGAGITVPFAGMYALGHGREYLNPYLGTCSPEDCAKRLRELGVATLVMNEGDTYDIL